MVTVNSSGMSDVEVVDRGMTTPSKGKVVILKPQGKLKHLMNDVHISLGIKSESTLNRNSFQVPQNLESSSSHPISFISRSAHVSITTDGNEKLFIKDMSGRQCLVIRGKPAAIGEVKVGDTFSLLPKGQFEYKIESFNPGAVVVNSPESGKKKRRSRLDNDADFEILEVVPKKPKVVKDLMTEVECTICFCPLAYSYMMPCQHTYCFECLRGHAVSSTLTSTGSSFPCPVCSKPAKLKDCVPNLKLDNLVEVLLGEEGGIEHQNHKLRVEYGKELQKNPNTNKPPPKLAAPKPFVPQKTTNAEKVAREQKRANRKANRSLNPARQAIVLDLT